MARWRRAIRGTDLLAKVQLIAGDGTSGGGNTNKPHYKVFLADAKICRAGMSFRDAQEAKRLQRREIPGRLQKSVMLLAN
jgi:hypothetical protein